MTTSYSSQAPVAAIRAAAAETVNQQQYQNIRTTRLVKANEPARVRTKTETGHHVLRLDKSLQPGGGILTGSTKKQAL